MLRCSYTIIRELTSFVNYGYEQGFFSGGRRGTRAPKHFVNLTGESKKFKMLDFPLNKLQILSLTAFIFSDLNYKIVIFFSQTESTPKHFFRQKALVMNDRILSFQYFITSVGKTREFPEDCVSTPKHA
jgi:hypothetical protein